MARAVIEDMIHVLSDYTGVDRCRTLHLDRIHGESSHVRYIVKSKGTHSEDQKKNSERNEA